MYTALFSHIISRVLTLGHPIATLGPLSLPIRPPTSLAGQLRGILAPLFLLQGTLARQLDYTHTFATRAVLDPHSRTPRVNLSESRADTTHYHIALIPPLTPPPGARPPARVRGPSLVGVLLSLWKINIFFFLRIGPPPPQRAHHRGRGAPTPKTTAVCSCEANLRVTARRP